MASTVDVQNTLPLNYTISPLISTAKSVLRKGIVQIQPNNTGDYSFSNNRMQFNIGNQTSFLVGPESYLRFEFTVTPSNPDNPSGSNAFTVTTTAPFSSMDNVAALDVGGVHACFKSIRVSAISQGTTIQQVDEYNRWNAVMSTMTESNADVDMDGWRYGDSSGTGLISQKPWKIYNLQSGVTGSPTVTGLGHFIQTNTCITSIDIGTTVTPAFTLMAFNVGVLSQLDPQPGDIMILNISTGTAGTPVTSVTLTKSVVATVLWANCNASATPGTTKDVVALDLQLGTTDVGSTTTIFTGILIKTYSRAAARSLVCNGRIHVLEMKPRMSFFDLDFPLFILRNGVLLELELDHPTRVLRYLTECDVNSGTRSLPGNLWYYMKNCLFIAKLSTPHPSVSATYVELWNSDRGLTYALPSVVARTYTGTAGSTTDVIRVNMGVRSLRRVVTVIYDQENAENQTKCTAFNNSISTFFRSAVYSYQYFLGSYQFPASKVYCYGVDTAVITQAAVASTAANYPVLFPAAVLVAGVGNAPAPVAASTGYLNSNYSQIPYESWEQTRQTYPSMGDPECRFAITDTQLVHSFTGALSAAGVPSAVTNETDRFFMTADFSRDNGPAGSLTGSDASMMPLQLSVERNSNNVYNAGGLSIPRYYLFGEYDAYLTLSSQGIFLLT